MLQVCGTEGMITVENLMPAVNSEDITSIERLPLTSNDKENFVDTVRHFAKVCMGRCNHLYSYFTFVRRV